jgi:hypothetical protein
VFSTQHPTQGALRDPGLWTGTALRFEKAQLAPDLSVVKEYLLDVEIAVEGQTLYRTPEVRGQNATLAFGSASSTH